MTALHAGQSGVAALVLALTAFLLSGCGDDEIASPVAEPIGFEQAVLVAGDATLRAWSPDRQAWAGEVGLGNAPNSVQQMGHSDTVLVVNSLSHDLLAIRRTGSADPPMEMLGSVDLGIGRNTSPYEIAVADDGMAYVTNLLANTVSVVDVSGGEIIDEWPVGRAPEGIVILDTLLAVINSGYRFSDFSFHDGSVHLLRRADGILLDTLALGVNPQFAAVDPVGRLHIGCTGDYGTVPGAIHIVTADAGQLARVDVLEVGVPVGRMAASADGRMAVAAGGWESDGMSGGQVLVYSGHSPGPRETLLTGLGAIDLTFNDDGSRLYVACREAMRIEIYDADLAPVRAIGLDDPPNAITFMR